MLFVRPGELRAAEWSEFVWDLAEWQIPAARMKMKVAHMVTLSTQAMGYANEVHSAHCFWATVRTIMDEIMGERVDLIEHQLAHG